MNAKKLLEITDDGTIPFNWKTAVICAILCGVTSIIIFSGGVLIFAYRPEHYLSDLIILGFFFLTGAVGGIIGGYVSWRLYNLNARKETLIGSIIGGPILSLISSVLYLCYSLSTLSPKDWS